MTRPRSALVRFGAFAVLALLLSACIKLDMNLTVNSDDTVDGTIIFALNKQLIQLSGQSADDLLGSSGPIATDAPGVSTSPYEDDEFQGQKITLDNVPLSRFNDENNGQDSLRIEHQGDTYVVSGALDLSQTGASGASGVTGLPDAQQLFASAQMKVSITFPGPVTESNGKVDGNTVTWVPKFGQRLELHAVADASGGGSSTTLILLIVAAVVVILAVILGVIAARRRSAGRAATEGETTTPGDGSPVVGSSAPPPGPGTATPPQTAPAPPPGATPPPPPPPPSEPQP
jgi:phosphatidylinositol mannoside-binding LppM-like protein